jgi:hypothetical protein
MGGHEVSADLVPVRQAQGTLGEDAAMEALAVIAKRWAQEPEPAQGFAIIGEGLAAVMPCERAYLLRWTRPSEELEVVGVFQGSEQGLQLGQVLPQERRDQELMRSAPEVMICSDTAVWLTSLERQMGEEGLRSLLAIVLRVRKEPAGLLVVASGERLAYGAKEVRVLRQMAPALVGHLRHRELRGDPTPAATQPPSPE